MATVEVKTAKPNRIKAKDAKQGTIGYLHGAPTMYQGAIVLKCYLSLVSLYSPSIYGTLGGNWDTIPDEFYIEPLEQGSTITITV
jgi:hypothetical protein